MSYPSPLWEGWRGVSAANNGPGGGDHRVTLLPPPRPPLRSADPPHKGEGDVSIAHSILIQFSNSHA